MSFCPICGAHHDPSFPCVDRAGEVFHETGVEKFSKIPKKEFKKLEKATNRAMLKTLLIVIAGFALLLLFVFFLER